jgi:adenylylsulfate kinase-like enzyme
MSLKSKYGASLVWLRCDLQTLISRDTKGLYRKALLPDTHPDKIHNLTGLNDTFEESFIADLVLDTDKLNAEECLGVVVAFLSDMKLSE